MCMIVCVCACVYVCVCVCVCVCVGTEAFVSHDKIPRTPISKPRRTQGESAEKDIVM